MSIDPPPFRTTALARSALARTSAIGLVVVILWIAVAWAVALP